MICKNCSTEFEGKFCPECGAPAQEDVAEVVETVETVAEPAEETVEAVAEVAAEPETVEFVSASTPEPEFKASYEAPATYGYTPPSEEQPKKKGKAGLVIGIIVAIIVLLAGAFCVSAFTDLVFSKQAQMVDSLTDFFDVDFELEGYDWEYIQGKMSATINDKHKEFKTEEDKELAKLIADFAKTLDVTFKAGADDGKAIYDITVNESNKALLNVQGALDYKNEQFLFKGDFTDITVRMALEGMNLDDMDGIDEEKLEAAIEAAKNKFAEGVKAALKNSEVTDGVYNGNFDLGAQVKTLTVTIKAEDCKKILTETVEAFFIKLGKVVPTEVSELLDDVDEDMTLSVFYDGKFSFDRTGYGFSIFIDNEETIVYSNGVNKRILGDAYNQPGNSYMSYIEIDFEKKAGGGERGTIKNVTKYQSDNNTFDSDNVTDVCTYDISKTGGTVTFSAEDVKFDFTYVLGGDKMEFDMKATVDGEELFTLDYEFGKAEPFTVTFNNDKVMDMEDESSALYTEFITDLQEWFVEKSETSELMGFALSLLDPTADMTDVEAYIYNEYGAEFVEAEFLTEHNATFILADEENAILDIQEIGYDGDTIKEMYQSVYVYVGDYTASQKETMEDSLYSIFGDVSDIDCAYVWVEDMGDWMLLEVGVWDLDVPANLKAVSDAEIIELYGSDVQSLSYKATETVFKNSGYTKIK
ncbi:MAG: hypothetical protein IKU25_00720 [Clostridia bacterium]|nr:hypothetical protein [Clostridia bacterium]